MLYFQNYLYRFIHYIMLLIMRKSSINQPTSPRLEWLNRKKKKNISDMFAP